MDGGDEELERLRALVAAIPDPIYRIRADGTFVGVEVPDGHPAAVPQDTIPGQTIRGVMPRRQAEVVMAGIAEALASGGLVTVEYELTVEGEQRAWEARIVPAGGDVYAIVRETTEERRRAEESLRRARTDPLTGLANRSSLYEHLDEVMARAERDGTQVAVLFTDLDRFKAVNDAHGHAVGDQVLADAASRIAHQVREGDLVARVGGDEVAVVLHGVTRAEVAAVAARLVESVAAPYHVGDETHLIGLSVGVAVHPGDADDANGLVAAADRAMYAAKAGGGTRVAWSSSPPDDQADVTRRATRGPGRAGTD